MNVDQLKDSLRELAESTPDGPEKAAVMVFANKAWPLVSAGLEAARADERERLQQENQELRAALKEANQANERLLMALDSGGV